MNEAKILNILTVLLIGLSSCLGSAYPQSSPVKAETTELSREADNESSNQLMVIEGELDIETAQTIHEDKQHVILTVIVNTEDETIL